MQTEAHLAPKQVPQPQRNQGNYLQLKLFLEVAVFRKADNRGSLCFRKRSSITYSEHGSLLDAICLFTDLALSSSLSYCCAFLMLVRLRAVAQKARVLLCPPFTTLYFSQHCYGPTCPDRILQSLCSYSLWRPA